jgi:hypothetical protein
LGVVLFEIIIFPVIPITKPKVTIELNRLLEKRSEVKVKSATKETTPKSMINCLGLMVWIRFNIIISRMNSISTEK